MTLPERYEFADIETKRQALRGDRMTIIIDAPNDLTDWLIADATQQGLTLEQYTLRTLQQVHQSRSTHQAEDAAGREERRQTALARIRGGAYKDLATSSDDFAAQKAEEIAREERP